MDTLDLQTFVSVARLGAMKRAAIELKTVQSNVTARIQGLEAELGASLFVRTPRGVKLTSAGERLMPFALEAERILGEAQTALKARHITELRIGSPEMLAPPLMPIGLAALSERQPCVELCWLTAPRATLLQKVASKELDAALGFGASVDPSLTYEALLHQEMCIVGREPVESAQEWRARDAIRFILADDDTVSRAKLARWALQEKMDLRSVFVAPSVAAALSCVEQGLGLAVLPSLVARWNATRARVYTRTLPREFDVTLGVLARRGEQRSPELDAFLHGIFDCDALASAARHVPSRHVLRSSSAGACV